MNVTLTTSDLITAGSSVVTAASLAWAIYERIRAKNARKEVQRFRHLLLRQEVSQQFSDVPEDARALVTHVRAAEWDQGAECALRLSAGLASLNGLPPDMIGDANKQQLVEVLGIMRQINQRIPKNGAAIDGEAEGALTDSCNLILLSVYAIERSLRVKAALGGEEDGE